MKDIIKVSDRDSLVEQNINCKYFQIKNCFSELRTLADKIRAKLNLGINSIETNLQEMETRISVLENQLNIINYTDALYKIWKKLEEITGERLCGIDMIVTPSFFSTELETTVHIEANALDSIGIFDYIALYIKSIDENLFTLLEQKNNVQHLEYTININKITTIKCVAKIFGIEYTTQKTIMLNDGFWLGAGVDPLDIMTEDNLVIIGNGAHGSYDIAVNNDDYIFVIIKEPLKDLFIRADMNGIEIPMNYSQELIVNNETFVVYKSEMRYNAGIYNIDING